MNREQNHAEKRSGTRTFAVGHLALGYLSGKATSKLVATNINLPLLFLAAIIPDIDLFLMPLMEHRGPTHSIIILTLLFIPIFIKYRKIALPYYVALMLHPILGDSLTGKQGTQLLWPLTTNWYGLGICMSTIINSSLEWMLFLGGGAILLGTKDINTFFQHHHANLLLIMPTVTVLLPALFSIPLAVPLALLIPHVALLLLFSLSILTDVKALLTPA